MQHQTFWKASELIDVEGWIDIGANADGWGGVPNQNTCHTHAKAKQSRIDGIIVDDAMLQMIKNVDPIWNNDIPTHGIVEMTLESSTRDDEMTQLRKLPTLNGKFDEFILKLAEGMDVKEKMPPLSLS